MDPYVFYRQAIELAPPGFSANDTFFSPDLAHRLVAAFTAGTRTPVNARNDALAVCARYAQDCALYAIDNELAETRNPDRQP